MKLLTIIIFLTSLLSTAKAYASEADRILKTTDIHGGICLMIGAQSLDLPIELAEKSALYIQLIQPDPKIADAWSKEISQSAQRNKLSVRNNAFNEDDYGSNLINLILVMDTQSMGLPTTGGNRAQDLIRILIPKGFLLSKGKFTPAESLKLSADTIKPIPSYPAIFQKQEKPITWNVANSLKWRAGARAHMSYGFLGVHGSGKYIYREYMEAKDVFPKYHTKLFARDAFNGRTLWTISESIGTSFKTWGIAQFSKSGHAMAIDDNDQFFYVTHDRKLICIDASTGVYKFTLMDSKARSTTMSIHNNKYLFHGNTVFSTLDGKKICKIPDAFVVHEDRIFSVKNGLLKIYNIADGSTVLEKKLEFVFPKKFGLQYLGGKLVISTGDRWKRPFALTAFDPSTGEKSWGHEFTGHFALPVTGKKGDKVFKGTPKYSEHNGKILASAVISRFHGDHQEMYITRIDPDTGKVEDRDYGYEGKLFGSNCNNGITQLGDYFSYWHNVWYNIKTGKRSFPYIVHPGCFTPTMAANGFLYNVPGRKNGAIAGITAIGPADITFDQAVGGKVLHVTGTIPHTLPMKNSDWPRYRNDEMRSNSTQHSTLGSKLSKSWTAKIGLGGDPYDIMNERRTGLTQATIAHGMAFTIDINAHCIVAVDIQTGEKIWSYSVSGRVEFPPALYKGLCLVAGQDAWIHCLNAKTGALVYRLLAAPRDRLIGGDEKLTSLWPARSDIFIKNDIGYISNGFANNVHGGSRALAFNVFSGKVLWAKCWSEDDTVGGYPKPVLLPGLFSATGDKMTMNGITIDAQSGILGKKAGGVFLRGDIDTLLAYGNSIGRINEDRTHDLFSDGRVKGRTLAFDNELSVAFTFKPKKEAFVNLGQLHIKAFKGKKNMVWSTDPIEFQVDDLVLTPKYVYAVGHYYRIKGESELWVMSRADGRVLQKYTIDGFPSFGGMSISKDRILIASREGNLICLQGSK